MAGKKLDEQMEKTIRNNYRRLTGCLIDRKMTITTMESITCGQIASLITDTEGASAILKGAFVTYSNEAKIMQGVPEAVIETCGVYSKETARAMAEACKQAYRADIGIGIMYIFQIFLTIGGGTKFIPLTGVTLPFISYGGSSVMTTMIMFFIIQGIYIRLQKEGERRGGRK